MATNNFLSEKDQKYAPIPVVDSIIKEIHQINESLLKIDPENSVLIKVPPRFAEQSAHLKRSQSVPRAQPRDSYTPYNRDQQEVAVRLSHLHNKVDRFLHTRGERSGSPIRGLVNESIINRSPSRVDISQDTSQVVQTETEKRAALNRSASIPLYRTAKSIEITGNASPAKEGVKKSVQWASAERPSTYHLQTYLRNSGKYESPLRSSYLANSPSKSILKKSTNETSPLRTSYIGGSPTKSPMKNSGFSSFILSSTMGSTQTLYNKEKLNNIIAGIKSRQAFEAQHSILNDSRSAIGSNKLYNSYIEATRKPVSAKPGLIEKETPRF